MTLNQRFSPLASSRRMRRPRRAKWLVLAAISAAFPGSAAAAPPSREFAPAAARATVEILVSGRHSGCGVIVNRRGTVVSAAHIIGRPDATVNIVTATEQRLTAKLVAVDLGHDLALLRLPERDEEYPAAELAEQFAAEGDRVLLRAAPVYRRPLWQQGRVAAAHDGFEYYGDRQHYARIRYVQALVQPGTSGGPWFTSGGKLAGIQSGTMQLNGAASGIAFVAPIGPIRRLLDREASAATPTLGAAVEELWQQPEKVRRRFPTDAEGLVIRSFRPEGPAERAGLSTWDLIVAADGRPVRRVDELLGAIRSHRCGEPLQLSVVPPDGAGEKEVAARLGELEVGWP